MAGEIADTVIWFVPESGGARPAPGRFSVYTQNKAFDPPLLVVPVGSTVAFPNSDPIRHNVYSTTPGSAFDFGFYGEGESRERVFDKPGVVVVNCNVHHVMQAQILVLPTVHHTRPGADGRYRMAGLPAGAGELHFWHPRAGVQTLRVALPVTSQVDRRIELSKPRAGRRP